MRIKIKFGPNSEMFDKPTNDYVNGFIHSVLGEGNKWHDAFSPYSVSTMHGGVFDKESGMIQFPNGGHFVVSSDNEEFLSDLLCGLAMTSEAKLQTMKYLGFDSYSCGASSYFDVLRVENIRLKKDDKEITFKDDGFIDTLLEHTKKKLKHNGIEDADAETIKFQPFHPENWKVKLVKMKCGTEKENITPSSTIMVVVRGKKVAREKILSLGLGSSTGSGFGFAITKNDKI